MSKIKFAKRKNSESLAPHIELTYPFFHCLHNIDIVRNVHKADVASPHKNQWHMLLTSLSIHHRNKWAFLLVSKAAASNPKCLLSHWNKAFVETNLWNLFIFSPLLFCVSLSLRVYDDALLQLKLQKTLSCRKGDFSWQERDFWSSSKRLRTRKKTLLSRSK
jgi:hypothetical protein